MRKERGVCRGASARGFERQQRNRRAPVVQLPHRPAPSFFHITSRTCDRKPRLLPLPYQLQDAIYTVLERTNQTGENPSDQEISPQRVLPQPADRKPPALHRNRPAPRPHRTQAHRRHRRNPGRGRRRMKSQERVAPETGRSLPGNRHADVAGPYHTPRRIPINSTVTEKHHEADCQSRRKTSHA